MEAMLFSMFRFCHERYLSLAVSIPPLFQLHAGALLLVWQIPRCQYFFSDERILSLRLDFSTAFRFVKMEYSLSISSDPFDKSLYSVQQRECQ